MTPEQFLVFARVLPEPLLLVTGKGEILATNRPLEAMFDITSKELRSKMLFKFVTEPPEKVLNYLQACSRSRQMVIGSLSLQKYDGQTMICRCQGAVIQPSSPESPSINLLRLENRSSASSNFVLLNQKIAKLTAENHQRKKAQEALALSNEKLKQTLEELQKTQLQLIQTEKMSSLGQLVAGVAHEINNPVSFIYGNLEHASEYIQDLLRLVHLYQKEYPNPSVEIQKEIQAIELDFLQEDLNQILESMRLGAERISDIVQSLRNFSRLDEAEFKKVDIHEGIDNTLMILCHRFTTKIKVIKEYGELPFIDCYSSQMNQVFMNILSNAIDALDEYNKKRTSEEKKTHPSTIRIRTELLNSDWVAIRIADNGFGISQEILPKVFDPFFTTKPVGKGKGLGLSISYQIVTEKHGGQLRCISSPKQGAEFIIEIPISAKSV